VVRIVSFASLPFVVRLFHRTQAGATRQHGVEILVKVKKLAIPNKLPQSSLLGPMIWDHSVTCRPTRMNTPRLTIAEQIGTRLTYPGGMEGWVNQGGQYIPRWFTRQ